MCPDRADLRLPSVGLTINNLLLVVDKLILPPDVDLSLWRNATVLLSMAVLLYGLIWDTE